MRSRKLTDRDVAEFWRLRRLGWGYLRLSVRFGISRETAKWRVLRGPPAPPAPAPPPRERRRRLSGTEVAEMCSLRSDGVPASEIAARFGVLRQTVYQRTRTAPPVRRAGRPWRPAYPRNSLSYHLLAERHPPVVEAALCSLTPGLRKYLDEDDELRRKRGPWR